MCLNNNGVGLNVRMMLEQGQEANAAEPEMHGCTALHVATLLQDVAMAALLLSYGADPFQMDGRGDTPMDVALAVGNQQLLHMYEMRCTVTVDMEVKVDPNARRMHLPPTPGQVLPDWQPCHILACKLQPCRQCLYPRHPTHNARTTPSQGSTAAPVQHDVASAAAPYGQLDPCSQAAHVLFLLDIARKTSNQTLLLAKLWLDTSTAPTFLPPGAATRGPDDHGLGLLKLAAHPGLDTALLVQRSDGGLFVTLRPQGNGRGHLLQLQHFLLRCVHTGTDDNPHPPRTLLQALQHHGDKQRQQEGVSRALRAPLLWPATAHGPLGSANSSASGRRLTSNRASAALPCPSPTAGAALGIAAAPAMPRHAVSPVFTAPAPVWLGPASPATGMLHPNCAQPAPSQASQSLPQPAAALSALRERTIVNRCHADDTVKGNEAPADPLLSAPPASQGQLQACASIPQDVLLLADRLRHLPLRTDLDFIVDAAQVELFQDQLLGAGRSSKVYKGKYKGRDVAVKLISDASSHNSPAAPAGPGLHAPECDAELNAALQVLGRLQHPNLASVQGACSWGPGQRLVLEERCACSLAQVLYGRRGQTSAASAAPQRLPLTSILKLAIDVFSALSYLHSLGVLHRDVNPNNVLINGPHAKLSDVGVWRHKLQPIAGSSDLFVGTLQYMAPECFSTQIGKVAAPADVFSAAVVVAEMLNHAPPWQGCHPMGVVFQLVVQGRRPHISDRHCPTSLRQLLLSCMRRQPCDRPSAVEVLEQLQCIRDGLGSPKYASN